MSKQRKTAKKAASLSMAPRDSSQTILLENVAFWKFSADNVKELVDRAETKADRLLEHSLRADGTALTSEDVKNMESPRTVMALAGLAMDLRNGLSTSANSYRQLVAFISFRQPNKKSITQGLLLSGFSAPRASEIIKIAFGPADVLTRFLEGGAGWWEALRLARAKPEAATNPQTSGSGNSSTTTTETTAEPADPAEPHPLLSNPLTTGVFQHYTTAMGVPMVGFQATVPLADAPEMGFNVTALNQPLVFCTQIKGFGTVMVSVKRI